MKFKVHISGTPSIANKFEIEGEDLINAVKENFHSLIYKADFQHVPYEYPITVKPEYKAGILGGRGGVSLQLSWFYSNHQAKAPWKHTNEIWIKANESDLTNTESFVVLGN